ncbi:hypothetical protein AnigIFM63309_005905 [Aspergillus niger]|nr:hypothetical protein AnigIFM63309_005905 [Aspergillus niger]
MTDPEHRAKMQHSFKTLNLDKALWEQRQRYFIMTTSAGDSIGFTDCEIEPFDHLVIPCGIAQVFVLRPIPKELLVDGEEGQFYKVVGRAYIEGISDREEVMPHPLRSEMERTSPTLFCLR